MTPSKSFQIAKGLSGRRLDRVLPILLGLSRKKVKMLLDGGRIFVNGRKVIIASWELKNGDKVEVTGEDAASISPEAKKYFLKVVYEDADLLIVEKDAGIGCEPSGVATRPSIVSIINAYLARKYPHLKRHYLGLVHR